MLGRPTWPINTPYAGLGGATPLANDHSTGCTSLARSSLHAGGANFAFCDGSVHFMHQDTPTDPAQSNCNKPSPANFPLLNFYFRDDRNPIAGAYF